MSLHLDEKIAIARTSIDAWNAFMRADPVFGRYAISHVGRVAFAATFTVVSGNAWRIGDKLHRLDGPARTSTDGTLEWFERGKRHRTGTPGSNEPAIEYADGNKMWYEHGVLHRIGGPAFISASGTKMWLEHNKLHRINGPAIIYGDGREEWYEHGEERSAPK